ncbi:MAG: DUF6588 family protein [Bacteroidota bacterium]
MFHIEKISGRFLACLLLSGALNAGAQISTIDFIYGGIEDTEKLLQEYIRPYANILGADLNGGWYTTARPHKLGGLDIMVNASVAFAPPEALQYDLAGLALNGAVEGNSTLAPTAAGQMNDRPSLVYSQTFDYNGTPQTVEIARFLHPDGTGIDFVPMPMGQLTVGLPLGTDISVRYVPTIAFRDYGEIGLWGVGGKHSISQYIPVIKKLKFLDISLQGGYTQVTASTQIHVQPMPVDVVTVDPLYWDDQFVALEISGWTANLIVSESIPFLNLYQSVGYAGSSCEVEMTGHYPVNTLVTEGADMGKVTYTVVENPIDMEFENYRNLRYNAGVRLTLGIFMLYYDFSHTLYSTHTAGFGITFR